MNPQPRAPGIYHLHAAGVADAQSISRDPESLLVERTECAIRVLARGPASETGRHPAAPRAEQVELPGAILLPGLVNAHTHLDLSGVGPQPHDPGDGLAGWVRRVMPDRETTEPGVVDSVRKGVELSLRGGTAAVGDIAGVLDGAPTLAPANALRASPLVGVSFVEHFGIGSGEEQWLAALDRFAEDHAEEIRDESGGVRVGLQPHAPYSTSPTLYRRAVSLASEHGLALSTHLAETLDERRFVADLAGPFADLLKGIERWDEAKLRRDYGQGQRPIAHLADILESAHNEGHPFLLAHVADVHDDEIELLARCGASVAYCPRAGEYFGTPGILGPHRYRDMLDAGVNVALGTDSVINLAADQVERNGMSILDEARLLFNRDGVDAQTLVRMATANGARALGIDEHRFLLAPDAEPLTIIAVEAGEGDGTALERVLRTDTPVEHVFP